MFNGLYSETDIFIRRDEAGVSEALVICDGTPIRPKISPQCEMYLRNPRMPSIGFEVGFGRNDLLREMRAIEAAVFEKFREFEADAHAAKADEG